MLNSPAAEEDEGENQDAYSGWLFASVLAAKEHDYEKGTLLCMHSTSCGMQEQGSKSLSVSCLAPMRKTKRHKKSCTEYVLQTNKLTYCIRPKDDKHPALLPIGETAQFRIQKDKLILRVPEADGKERFRAGAH